MRHFQNTILFILLLLPGKWCLGQRLPDATSDIRTGTKTEIKSGHFMDNLPKPFGQQRPSAFYEKALTKGDELVRDGKYDDALDLYRNMLLHTPPSSPYRQNIYSQLANLYSYTGSYREAIETYHLALELTKDTTTHVKLLVNISTIYIDLKDYKKALQNLDYAIRLLKHDENGYWAALAHSNKGTVYNAQNMYSSAIAEFREAYKVAVSIVRNPNSNDNRRQEMKNFSSVILNNIADTYLKQDMLDSALHYLQQISPDFEGLSQYTKCTILVTLGQVYSRKGADKIALSHMKLALAIGEPSRYLILNRQAYESMAAINDRMGNYKTALDNQKRYIEINDSLLSIENIQKINNLERQYDLSQRDRELVQKELLISKQARRLKEQNWLAGILILAVASLGSIFLISRRSHRNKQKLLKEQLSSNLKDRKIMQIHACIKGEEKERTRIARDLHDGVVSEMLAMKLNLQALGTDHQQLKQTDDYRNILFQAEEVTEKLRRAAHNLMPANLQEHGLIQTIEAFLNRINNHNIQFTFQHCGTMPDLNEITGKIILMMTMELIQNILKHAKATEAIIQFDFFEDSMSITAEDNGVGIGNSFIEKKGIGLTNIERNVQLLNGTLDIRSSEYTGTTVLIEIPWNENILQNRLKTDESAPEANDK
jgi:signal transduction histidine kinase